mgnify:CR=1 FL=1
MSEDRPLLRRQKQWVAAMIEHRGDIQKASAEVGYTYWHGRQLASGNRTPQVKKALDAAMLEVADECKYRGLIDREDAFEELMRVGDKAMDAGDYKSGVRSRVDAYKLVGLYVHKIEDVTPGRYHEIDPDELTDEEFEVYAAYEELREKLQAKAAKAPDSGGATP